MEMKGAISHQEVNQYINKCTRKEWMWCLSECCSSDVNGSDGLLVLKKSNLIIGVGGEQETRPCWNDITFLVTYCTFKPTRVYLFLTLALGEKWNYVDLMFVSYTMCKWCMCTSMSWTCTGNMHVYVRTCMYVCMHTHAPYVSHWHRQRDELSSLHRCETGRYREMPCFGWEICFTWLTATEGTSENK